jgi:hypothetical protein
MQAGSLIKIIGCFLLFTAFCFAAGSPHDPTRPATYADSEQPLLMDINGKQVTLNGVLISPLRRIAVVNGIAFQVGDTESGIKVLSIDENVVRISKDQQEMQLIFPLLEQKAIAINENKSKP